MIKKSRLILSGIANRAPYFLKPFESFNLFGMACLSFVYSSKLHLPIVAQVSFSIRVDIAGGLFTSHTTLCSNNQAQFFRATVGMTLLVAVWPTCQLTTVR